MDDRAGAALDAHCRRLFMDDATQRLHGRRFAQRQIKRMDMPATHVEHPPDILIASHDVADTALIHQLQLRVPESFPQTLLRFQVIHLFGRDGGKHAAVLQIALDVVPGHPITNDPPTLERHLPQQLGLAWTDTALDHIDITAVAVDDLPTIAPRRTETHPGRFQYRYPKAVLQQEQGRRQSGITGADHADVSLDLTLQRRAGRHRIGRCGVIGFWVWGVRHPAASV
ncbi:hypothetical protein D3C76_1000040 [compost metagenome]